MNQYNQPTQEMQGGNSRGDRVPNNRMKQGRDGETEDQVEVDDIQFENKLEYDEDDDDSSPNNQYYQQPRANPQQYAGGPGAGQPSSGGSGKPGRIGAYRKSNSGLVNGDESGNLSQDRRRRNTDAGRSPINNYSKDDDDDESATTPNLITMELDSKHANQNLLETEQVEEIVNQIEGNYSKYKKKINGYDVITLESDIVAQTLNACYATINNCLSEENESFDTEKMNSKLDQILNKVQTNNADYNKFKGEFLAANEPIMNKDILAIKADRAQRYLEKQEAVLTKLPNHENIVVENQSTLIQMKKKYEIFEDNLFEKKIQETRLVIKDTEDLIDKIEEKQDELSKLVEDGITNHIKVTPQNNEQRQKYQKIHQDLIGIQKRVEDSEYVLNQDMKEKSELDTRHDESEDIKKAHKSVEVVSMIAQSRKMKSLVETHRKWVILYKRLKNLQDEDLDSIEQFLGRAISSTKKYAEGVNSEQRDEYNDILRKIQKYAKKVQDDVDEQNARLEGFEKKVLGDPQNPNTFIADVDLLILRKEVSRNKGAIESIRTMTFEILEESQYIKDDGQRGFDKLISSKDLKALKSNLKALQKQDQVDVPRIKSNIDALEGFSVKSLKNQLNDDNKKSQSQISAMKKSFEDLQKKIDALNKKQDNIKITVQTLSDTYEDEDLERENDFINKIHDKLTSCDRDINGEKEGRGDASDREDAVLDKLKSLQSRKKLIISKINSMVGQFNENNKLIKDANKVQRTEKEMGELIAANKKIQEECAKIHDKINSGKEFAVEINDRLDKIVDPVVPKLREKYDSKKKAIEACDAAYNDNTDMLTDQEKNITGELEKINIIIARLETVNPINNPSIPGKDNSKFLKDVSAKLDSANKYRDDLEIMQEKMNKTKDDMDNMIDPLNELADRVVPKDEIDDILKDLKAMNQDLTGNQRDILPLKQGIASLQGEVEQMLERDKGRKIDEAEKNLGDLDGNINNLENKLDDVIAMLNEYKNKIAKAKTQEGREDAELLGKLKELESEAKGLEREIGDLEGKINDLKKKRNDSKKLLDDIKRNPQKYNPQQIDQLLVGLSDQVERAEGINDKADVISQDLERRMRELDELLLSTGQRKGHHADIDAALQQMLEDFASFQGVLDKVPKQIEMMLNTLREMEIGAGPDKTADYWEEREQIKKHIEALTVIRVSLEQLGKVHAKKKAEFDEMQARLRKNQDNDGLQKLAADLRKASIDLQEHLNACFDARDGVNNIKDEMGDCEIPVNISVRRNEVQAYLDRLERIKMDFRDMKQGDDDYEGEAGSEREIKMLIKQIDQSIRGYDTEGRDLSKYQNQKLDMYSEKEFLGYVIYTIIIEVREFKLRVWTSMQKLQDLEDLCAELNNKLIQQDMDNATVLLTKKSQKLRERLIAAQKGLKKISTCGDDMDGNTTHNEEDEFIDALKDEMPEVFKNIDMNFEQIDGIDVLLKTVVETRDIEKMSLLKKEIDDANNKVEQSEGLVVKLENEIVEWNAFKKLCRRDEELQEIESLLKDFNLDLNDEVKMMEKELIKNTTKLEKEEDPKGIIQGQRVGITNYMDEIDELQNYINDLNNERNICFKEFNLDLPRIVQEARIKRNQMADFNSPNSKMKKAQTAKAQNTKGIDFPTDNDKPSDIYYMITINCRYRKRIHEMLKELRNINQRRRELEEKYAALKRELSAVKLTKVYRPTKGDAIDELFAQHMNKACLNLPVKRLAPGKYLFGTKQILAKIINGKLVIRVGGGYMSADEFIEQYGKIEIMKLMREQENNSKSVDGQGSGRGVGKMDGQPAAGIADMKEMMKSQMMNVKVYEANSSSPSGGFGSGRGQADFVKTTSKRTLVQLESKYEMATISKQGMSPMPNRSNRLDMTGPSPLRDKSGLMARQGSNDNFGRRLGSPGAGRR